MFRRTCGCVCMSSIIADKTLTAWRACTALSLSPTSPLQAVSHFFVEHYVHVAVCDQYDVRLIALHIPCTKETRVSLSSICTVTIPWPDAVPMQRSDRHFNGGKCTPFAREIMVILVGWLANDMAYSILLRAHSDGSVCMVAPCVLG